MVKQKIQEEGIQISNDSELKNQKIQDKSAFLSYLGSSDY